MSDGMYDSYDAGQGDYKGTWQDLVLGILIFLCGPPVAMVAMWWLLK